MTYARDAFSNDPGTLPQLPAWVTSARAQTPADVAFLSGAALSHLHMVLANDAVPQSLLRERLALQAAEACVVQSGRTERAAGLRDAVQFLHPGDLPGPAGETYLCWRRAVERPVSIKALHRALPVHSPEQLATWLDAGRGGLIEQASSTLETVLAELPRGEVTALILADAVLATALGWDHVVPLLADGLKRADLRKRGEDLQQACHRAVTASAVEAARRAVDLARRKARLNAVAPKLRAKGAGEALEMLLTRDAVAPSALTSLNSDRAARRFCDRLVALGAVRELTGRDSFRLYGL